jgi:hypothetical protein
MTVYGQFGIFEGGVVDKSGSSRITITPYLVNTETIGITGAGGDGNGIAKTITLRFGSPTTELIQSRTATYVASPEIIVGNTGPGFVWLYFDENILDIAMSDNSNKPVGVVFAKLVWGGATADISGITIDTTGINRDEAYVAESTDPDSAEKFISEGFRWNPGNKNRPMANFALLSKVIQAETKLMLGEQYFLTMAQNSDIEGTALTVKIKPMMHQGRFVGDIFRSYNWPENPTIPGYAYMHTFTSVVEFQGQTIYIAIDNETGEPLVATSYNPATHSLVAIGPVSPTETDLVNVDFEIVNNLGGQSQLVQTVSGMVRGYYAPGFLTPFHIRELPSNSLRLLNNTIVLDGFLKDTITTDVDLTAAPLNVGEIRYDFVYIRLWKKSVPWIELEYTYHVVTDVDIANYDDPFQEPGKVLNGESNNYVYNRSGYYTASNTANPVDNLDYAIPIAVVRRYNQEAYSPTNKNGGSSRPDGKTYDNISVIDDVNIRAPHTTRRTLRSLLSEAVKQVLEGNLTTSFQESANDPGIFANRHLQTDRLGTAAVVTGSSLVGTIDGMRYFWSNQLSKDVTMYALLKFDVDSGIGAYNFPSVTYNNAGSTLIIKVPDGTNGVLARDVNNLPKNVKVVWVDTGKDVVFLNPWSVGDPRNAQAVLDTSDLDYIDATTNYSGEFAIMFDINYTDTGLVGLSQVPFRIIDASLNNDPSLLANTFAVSLDSFENPTWVKDMSRVTVIGSENYTDKLYLQKSGDVRKGHIYEVHYHVAGNNDTISDYVIPDAVIDGGNYAMAMLLEARRLDTNEVIPITLSRWMFAPSNEFRIRLSEAVPTNVAVKFVFGTVEGDADKQIDIVRGNLSINNITEAKMVSLTGDETNDGTYSFSDGHLIYGTTAQNYDGIKRKHVAYVDEELVPCTVEGIGTNRVVITIQIEDITGLTPAAWFNAGSYYIPATGTQIRFSTLRTYKLSGSELYIRYQYNSLPFIPYQATAGRYGTTPTLENNLPYNPEDRRAFVQEAGYIFMSTDGTANEGSSIASPASKRFPVVDGIQVIGGLAVNKASGLIHIHSGVAHKRELYLEGIS